MVLIPSCQYCGDAFFFGGGCRGRWFVLPFPFPTRAVGGANENGVASAAKVGVVRAEEEEEDADATRPEPDLARPIPRAIPAAPCFAHAIHPVDSSWEAIPGILVMGVVEDVVVLVVEAIDVDAACGGGRGPGAYVGDMEEPGKTNTREVRWIA